MNLEMNCFFIEEDAFSLHISHTRGWPNLRKLRFWKKRGEGTTDAFSLYAITQNKKILLKKNPFWMVLFYLEFLLENISYVWRKLWILSWTDSSNSKNMYVTSIFQFKATSVYGCTMYMQSRLCVMNAFPWLNTSIGPYCLIKTFIDIGLQRVNLWYLFIFFLSTFLFKSLFDFILTY